MMQALLATIGSAITYLKSDGTTGTVTPGSMTGGVYAKYGAAFTGTVNAASTVGGTIVAEASHTHSVAAGTTGAPSATQQIALGGGNAGGQNYLAYSEQWDNAVWARGTGATVTPNNGNGPDGSSLTADTVSIGVNPAQIWQYRAAAIPAGNFTPSFWIYPISTTGSITILNARTSADGSAGWWDLNLASLPASTWTRVTPTTPGVVVHNPFVANGTTNDGLCMRATTTVSFYAWGAQINTGTLVAPYQQTTATAVGTWGGVALSVPDPAHTHANGAAQTSGAGSSHTHTFTGAAIGDPTNEVFLPYFRR